MASRLAASYLPCRLASITVVQLWRASSSKLLAPTWMVAMVLWVREPT